MRLRSLPPGPVVRWVPVLALLLVAVAGCAQHYPQTTLAPKGDFAQMVDHVFRATVRWAVLVFLLVEGALLYAIIRFRGRSDDPEPEQVHGNTTLEIIWTAIPAIILVIVAIPTIRTIFETARVPRDDALTVEVIGHQWWWEFRYPTIGITTANELHVPAGRTVDLRLKSMDVIHSFWIPQLAGKRDVFPGRETRIWFTASDTGTFSGQCAEFCGIQHGKMGFRIVVSDSTGFGDWAAAMSNATGPVTLAEPATALDSLATAGQQLFTTKACVGCHSFNAVTPPPGMVGPNLANVGTRKAIAAGMLDNNNANLARWIQHPQSFKEGSHMPDLALSDGEVQALVAYLRQQRVRAPAPVAAPQ